MPHKNYILSGFTSPLKQRNIIAFVGNGFDIQAMSDYGSSINTRYESFYHFLKLRSFDPTNMVFSEMDSLRSSGKENWSDVEAVVSQLLERNRGASAQLATDLLAVQSQFAAFLDLAVPSSLLLSLGEDSVSRKLAVASLEGFLADLDAEVYRQMSFPGRSDNFDVYNFLFFNFNYTPLLDNYIYLDQRQFDPAPYRTVDRNFTFRGNPRQIRSQAVRPGDTFSSYVMTEIVHPHGNQGVPRSLLFGIDTPAGPVGNQDAALRLSKPFWAQNQRRYEHLFNDTELYILFGCSIGDSDKWWWKQIAESLGVERTYTDRTETYIPELLIYWYNSSLSPKTVEDVRLHFLQAAGVEGRADDLSPYIHIVLFDSTTERTWLSTKRSTGQ